MSELNISLLAAFAILQGLDIYTTQAVLKQGPQYHEANPFMAYLFEKFGIIKTLVPAKLLAVFAMALLGSSYDPMATVILVAANVVYLAIVCHNFNNIK